jgi:hypothetical protein
MTKRIPAHMSYEKPKIIDLSNRPEKGSGEGCLSGSGETFNCQDGSTADQVGCEVGNVFSILPKYED